MSMYEVCCTIPLKVQHNVEVLMHLKVHRYHYIPLSEPHVTMGKHEEYLMPELYSLQQIICRFACQENCNTHNALHRRYQTNCWANLTYGSWADVGRHDMFRTGLFAWFTHALIFTYIVCKVTNTYPKWAKSSWYIIPNSLRAELCTSRWMLSWGPFY